MADNPFFNTNLLALGGQMAQAWQKALESWWQGLLGDRERLKELARQLEALRPEPRRGEVGQEMNQIVEALELMERRQRELEDKVASLAENVSAVVTYLERREEGSAGPTEERGGPPDRPQRRSRSKTKE